jgi:hypothetical protein
VNDFTHALTRSIRLIDSLKRLLQADPTEQNIERAAQTLHTLKGLKKTLSDTAPVDNWQSYRAHLNCPPEPIGDFAAASAHELAYKIVGHAVMAADRIAQGGSIPGAWESLRSAVCSVVPDFHVEKLKALIEDEAARTERTAAPCEVHSADFRSVRWFGREYSFSAPQAACVRVLWENWEQGTPEVGNEYLATTVECGRIPDLFRGHAAWKTMIVSGQKKGNYRLQEPEK